LRDDAQDLCRSNVDCPHWRAKYLKEGAEWFTCHVRQQFFALIGVLGLTLMMIYPLVGAEVTQDGILREALFLIPLGYVCIAWA